MARILNILRSWRLVPRETEMEVAVDQDSLIRLRPVVHCDRDMSGWGRYSDAWT